MLPATLGLLRRREATTVAGRRLRSFLVLETANPPSLTVLEAYTRMAAPMLLLTLGRPEASQRVEASPTEVSPEASRAKRVGPNTAKRS